MKKELFGDSQKDVNFKVNKAYESRFNERKQREETSRLKQKYASEFKTPSSHKPVPKKAEAEALAEESVSSLISEDEAGKMANDEVITDFISTLSKIKAKHPEIYQKDKQFFTDEVAQYVREEGEAKRKEETKVTLRTLKEQQLREGKVDDSGEEETEEQSGQKNGGLSIREQQAKLKKDFLAAVKGFDDKAPPAEDLLKRRDKTAEETAKERLDYETFLAKKRVKPEEKEIVNRYWSDTAVQSHSADDRFLHNFILNKRWIDREGRTDAYDVDEEEQMDERIDRFEAKYNFRFEEPNAAELISHPRKIPDTVREEPNKRKEERERKRQIEEEKKEQVRKELEAVKKVKTDEIIDQIIKLQRVSGNKNPHYEKMIREALEGDFDANYDKVMAMVFGDDYYEQNDDKSEEIEEYLDMVEDEYDQTFGGEREEVSSDKQAKREQLREQERADDLLVKPALPIAMRHKIDGQEMQLIQKQDGHPIWWYCDVCWRGIKPLEPRFDCLECPDHTECKQCLQTAQHEHKLKKFVVPEGCHPPSDEQIRETLGHFKFCDKCSGKIPQTDVYYMNKAKADIVMCSNCINFLGSEFRLRDFAEVQPRQKDKRTSDPALQQAVDDVLNVNFEDVIGGDLKTRYEYIDVQAEDMGLTDAELLYADDKLLNRMLSIKKLVPYKDGMISQQDRDRIRKMRTLVRESAERNMKKFQAEMALYQEEEELREAAKKGGKAQTKYEQFLAEKKERIEAIYKPEKPVVNVLRPPIKGSSVGQSGEENKPEELATHKGPAEHAEVERESTAKLGAQSRPHYQKNKQPNVPKSRLNTYGINK